MLFDDKSVVDKLEHKRTICDSASENTTYVWVVTDTNNVKITWTDKFINSRHVNNRWLNKVKTFAPSKEISIYEDLYGDRTNNAIDNIRGTFLMFLFSSLLKNLYQIFCHMALNNNTEQNGK